MRLLKTEDRGGLTKAMIFIGKMAVLSIMSRRQNENIFKEKQLKANQLRVVFRVMSSEE